MSCVARPLTYISDITRSDGGEYFDNPEQVRAYFKVEVMERNYPGRSKRTGLKQEDLNKMARATFKKKP
jgi:hypothetical protein